MNLPGRKRRAVGWATVVFLLGMFVFGIVWAVLYYGALLPMSQSIPAQFSGSFDTISLTFMDTIIGWWPFIVLVTYLLWLWQRSNKTGLTY